MARWVYVGRTPSALDAPDRGGMILSRGFVFEASERDVAPLLAAGLVARLGSSAAATDHAEPAPAAPTASFDEVTHAVGGSVERDKEPSHEGDSGGSDGSSGGSDDSVASAVAGSDAGSVGSDTEHVRGRRRRWSGP